MSKSIGKIVQPDGFMTSGSWQMLKVMLMLQRQKDNIYKPNITKISSQLACHTIKLFFPAFKNCCCSVLFHFSLP